MAPGPGQVLPRPVVMKGATGNSVVDVHVHWVLDAARDLLRWAESPDAAPGASLDRLLTKLGGEVSEVVGCPDIAPFRSLHADRFTDALRSGVLTERVRHAVVTDLAKVPSVVQPTVDAVRGLTAEVSTRSGPRTEDHLHMFAEWRDSLPSAIGRLRHAVMSAVAGSPSRAVCPVVEGVPGHAEFEAWPRVDVVRKCVCGICVPIRDVAMHREAMMFAPVRRQGRHDLDIGVRLPDGAEYVMEDGDIRRSSDHKWSPTTLMGYALPVLEICHRARRAYEATEPHAVSMHVRAMDAAARAMLTESSLSCVDIPGTRVGLLCWAARPVEPLRRCLSCDTGRCGGPGCEYPDPAL